MIVRNIITADLFKLKVLIFISNIFDCVDFITDIFLKNLSCRCHDITFNLIPDRKFFRNHLLRHQRLIFLSAFWGASCLDGDSIHRVNNSKWNGNLSLHLMFLVALTDLMDFRFQFLLPLRILQKILANSK